MPPCKRKGAKTLQTKSYKPYIMFIGMRATKNILVRWTESVGECMSTGQSVLRKYRAPIHSSSTVLCSYVTYESHHLHNMFFKIIGQDDD